jgi:hypothetical protein
MKRQMFGSAMGVLTVAQEGDGWVVLEDGRRVGGTLLVPFASREAAQRYVEKELAAEAETIASGDIALSAKARAIRDLDAEVWARFEGIEKEFAGKDEAEKQAAHNAAGTSIVIIQISMAVLEAEGKIYRTGETRDGSPVFAARKHNQH